MLRQVRKRLADEDLTDLQKRRQTKLEQDLLLIITQSVDDIQGQLFPELEELAEYEDGFTQRVVGQAVTAEIGAGFTSEQIAALATRSKAVLIDNKGNKQSLTPDQMIQQFTKSTDAQLNRTIKQAIQAGNAEGQTNQQIVKAIMQATDNRTRAQAEALTRTLSNHYASQAREQVYRNNSDVIQAERWVATLDSRTRVFHANLDSKKFPVGKGPKAPLGYNCRCIRVPVVVDDENDPALRGQRASKFGPVDSRSTFPGWFSKQSDSFQREYLGEERYELYKKGQVTFSQFTDDKGKTLTLKELSKLEGVTLDKDTVEKPKPQKEPPAISREEKEFISKTKPKRGYKKPDSTSPVELPIAPSRKIAPKPKQKPVLTNEEKASIEYYKGDGFYDLNRILRDPNSYSESELSTAMSQADRINKAIGKSKTTKDQVFYRGIRSKELFRDAEKLIGKSLKNKTPQSVTWDESVSEQYAGIIAGYSAEPEGSVIMKISARKGSSALNVSSVTDINSGEREILLKSGTSYKVTRVSDKLTPDGRVAAKVIEVEYVE